MNNQRIRGALLVFTIVGVFGAWNTEADTIIEKCSGGKKTKGELVCQTNSPTSPERCVLLLVKELLVRKGLTNLTVTNIHAEPTWENTGMSFTAIDARGINAFSGVITPAVSEIFPANGEALSTEILGLQCKLGKCSDSGYLFRISNIESNDNLVIQPATPCGS